MTRLLSRYSILPLSSDHRLTLHTDLSGSDVQASCVDMQVIEDFRPYYLVTKGDFLATVNQSRTSPLRVAQAVL